MQVVPYNGRKKADVDDDDVVALLSHFGTSGGTESRW